ncbi:MAG: FecR domain-containing protein [Methylococcales bacterium]
MLVDPVTEAHQPDLTVLGLGQLHVFILHQPAGIRTGRNRSPSRFRQPFREWSIKKQSALGPCGRSPSLLTVCLLVSHPLVPYFIADYSTAVGEVKSLHLSDGNTVHLNTGSMIAENFSENERNLELLAGATPDPLG